MLAQKTEQAVTNSFVVEKPNPLLYFCSALLCFPAMKISSLALGFLATAIGVSQGANVPRLTQHECDTIQVIATADTKKAIKCFNDDDCFNDAVANVEAWYIAAGCDLSTRRGLLRGLAVNLDIYKMSSCCSGCTKYGEAWICQLRCGTTCGLRRELSASDHQVDFNLDDECYQDWMYIPSNFKANPNSVNNGKSMFMVQKLTEKCDTGV